MQERFKQLLEEKGLTATKFAAIIKVNASAMSHILNGRSKPGFDVLDKIAQAFPDVNLNWLISGKGNLYNHRETEEKRPEPRPYLPTTEVPEKNIEEEKSFVSQKETEEKSVPLQTVPNKKISRIILFFDDGSFEDYTKN